MTNYKRYIFLVFVVYNIFGTMAGTGEPDARAHLHAAHNNDNNGTIEPRILGGRVVDITRHPYLINLRIKDILPSYDHVCGGSIYSKRIIITAAHCVHHNVASQLKVVAATNHRTGNDGVIVPVQEIIIHEQYSSESNNNDIALLVLAIPLPLNNFTMKSIELTNVEPQHGNIATITGWGVTENGYASELLREVHVPIVSNEVCRRRYFGLIHDSMLCAGLLDIGGKDSCQMDSGGPLLVNGKLAGVVSWGSACGDPSLPGVYANVWYLIAWLREKIEAVESMLS